MGGRSAAGIVVLLGLLAGTARAAPDLVRVRFEATQPTAWGESLYLIGDRPELGAWDATRALRMVPVGPHRWSLDVALPAGVAYRHGFVVRDNAPARLGDRANGRWVSGPHQGQAPGKVAVRKVRLRYLSGFAAPRARFERAPGRVEEAPMLRAGPGRGVDESLWEATLPVEGALLDVVLVDGATGRVDRAPGGGSYRTTRDAPVIVDGEVRPDVPPARRSRPRLVRVAAWYSNVLRNARDVVVWLPRDYDGSTRRYPVLYAHDGQNLFGQGGPFGSWKLEEAAERGTARGQLEDVIIVGVANTHARMEEYIPPQDGGRADEYVRFLADELKPWVDRSFRTRTDAASTGLVGSSLGGLVSFYAAWERPDVFGRAACLSSSFWLRGHLDAIGPDPARALRLWLDSGTAGRSGDSCEDTVAARDLLLSKGFTLGDDLQHAVDHGAGHEEAAWRGRVGQALAWLFPAE